MTSWSRRDWVAVFVVPVVATVVGAIMIHYLTKPDAANSVGSRWEWSFFGAFARLLPTLIGMSFVYHLTVLPFVHSRTRRSMVLLTMFMGPALAGGVLMVGLMVCPLAVLGVMADAWGRLVDVLRFHGGLAHQVKSILGFGSLCVMGVTFVVAAALCSIGRDRVEGHPAESQGGRRALLGLLLTMVLSAPLWISMGRDWQHESDRAGCIMNIRNAHQAMRSYMGMNGHSPGDRLPFTMETIVGPGNFLEREPACPAGGTYSWVENRHPAVGELVIQCSCPDHRPINHQDW